MNPLILIERFENFKPFTEQEAWNIFKLTAIAEAIGWTLLIIGIFIRSVSGAEVPVILAGRTHGVLFSIYIVAVVLLYANLGWSRKRMFVAGMASVPPYGSLLFEQWAAYKRRSAALKNYRHTSVRAVIINEGMLLVTQFKDSSAWQLPGGQVMANETVETSLIRHVYEQTTVRPKLGRLLYVSQGRIGKTESIELFFVIENGHSYNKVKLRKHSLKSSIIDDIQYCKPGTQPNLRPSFIASDAVIADAQDSAKAVTFLNETGTQKR